MIALATGNPSAKIDGDRILVSFPSGGDKVQVSLSLNQVLNLSQVTHRTSIEALKDGFAAPREAEIAAFRVKGVANG